MRLPEPRDVLREREAEGEGNRVLSVRPPDLRRVRFLPAAADELLLEVAEEGKDHGAQGLAVAQRRGRVQDVRRGCPEVEERPHRSGRRRFSTFTSARMLCWVFFSSA